MKYYAVKVGRVPGIYQSWSECKLQVNGYSGAVFKSFKSLTEARNFYTNTTSLSNIADSDSLEIFTDGSHFKGGSIMGYGMLFRYLDKEYGFCRYPVTPSQLTEMFGGDFTKVSNPTMEFAAIAHALKICNDFFADAKTIDITYDYIGSKNWLLGSWKCHKEYIKLIYTFAKTELDKLTKRKVQINWIHVKSHTGHRENELADSLAKGEWPEGLEHIEKKI